METKKINLETLLPMQGRVLVEEILPDFSVKGDGASFLRPSTPNDRDLVYATVIKLGAESESMTHVPEHWLGKIAMFVEYSSAKVPLDGKSYRLLRYEDVIAIVDEKI